MRDAEPTGRIKGGHAHADLSLSGVEVLNLRTSMDLRRMTRIEGGFPCEVRNGPSRQEGTVTNLAPDGLFVRTRRKIPQGSQVEVHIPEGHGVAEMTLRAIVVRQRLLPNPSFRLTQDGVGMRILEAPKEYYALAERERKSSESSGEPPGPLLETFHVRVIQKSGSVSRILTVASTSPEAAREEIEEELGPNWVVTKVLSR